MLRFLLVLLLLLPMAACDSANSANNSIRRVLIAEISVNDAPLQMPDGSNWDGPLGGGPDIYPVIVSAASGADVFPNLVIENVSGVDQNDFPLRWAFTNELSFTRLNTDLAIELWDSDTTTDEYMGSTVSFNIQDIIDSGEPAVVQLTTDDPLIELDVSIVLRYER